MGNLLGTQQPDWVPNIVAGDGNQRPNDLNYPLSAQARDSFLSFTIPTVAVAVFARAAYEYQQERSRLVEWYTGRLNDLETEMEALRLSTDATQCQLAANHKISELISTINQEETATYTHQLHKLDWYDEGLKTILDIRCSPFKRRAKREILENELLTKVATDDSLKDVVIYPGVRDSIDFDDYRFCGRDRESNGKFRQIYMRMYRQKLLLEKERRVMARVQEQLKSVDGL